MKVAAIIVAAGSGRRMASDVPKQFLSLAGRPIVSLTLEVFESAKEVDDIILVVPAGEEDRCRRECVTPYSFKKVTQVIQGGPRRQDSVFSGLRRISQDTDIVLVHDGVRPFVTPEMIRQSIDVAVNCGGAVVALPIRDTLKKVGVNGYITDTIDRTSLWLAQTPQAFRRPILMEAYEKASIDGVVQTDDAALVERLGYSVSVIPGSRDNIKITERVDLLLAEDILTKRNRGAM